MKKMNKEERSKMGKRNRDSGARFERKVRKDIEDKKLVVSRWGNNVDLDNNKLVPAKSTRFRSNTHGFPDFIVYKCIRRCNLFQILGIECKSNGQLSKVEKEKCAWLIKNKVFGEIRIVMKGKKRGEIIYKRFEETNRMRKEETSK